MFFKWDKELLSNEFRLFLFVVCEAARSHTGVEKLIHSDANADELASHINVKRGKVSKIGIFTGLISETLSRVGRTR